MIIIEKNKVQLEKCSIEKIVIIIIKHLKMNQILALNTS